jgi:hypothetical protein
MSPVRSVGRGHGGGRFLWLALVDVAVVSLDLPVRRRRRRYCQPCASGQASITSVAKSPQDPVSFAPERDQPVL